MLDINLVKTQNPSSNISCGSVITYSMAIQNNSHFPIYNAVILDTIPRCTTFIADSLSIDGSIKIGSTPIPPAGVNIGTVPSGVTTTVAFKVIVTTTPCECIRRFNRNYIENNSTLTYNYQLDPNFPVESGSAFSNATTVPLVCDACPSLVKYVDKSHIVAGDTLTYTIGIRNYEPVTLSNVFFMDTIPGCTSFLANSVMIDSIPSPGANPNPPSSIPIGNIGPGGISTVSFKVRSTRCPCTIVNRAFIAYTNLSGATLYSNSNSVTSSCSSPIIKAIKCQDAPINPRVGDTITYTIGVQNNGGISIGNAVLLDTIPLGTQFVDNSVKLNEVTLPNANPNPPTGVAIGTISAGSSSTLSFKVTITTIPEPITIVNYASLKYTYTMNSIVNSASTTTNTVTLASANCLNVRKSVDKTLANFGDNITYTIVVKNNCSTTASNVFLTDHVSPCLGCPQKSTLNGVQIIGNPIYPSSIPLGNIGPNSTSTVTFQVTAVTCPCVARNIAYINYQNNGQNMLMESNIVSTTISCAIIPIPLEIKKETCNCISCLGDKIPFIIKVKNISAFPINNIVVENSIPIGTYISSSTVSNGSINELNGKLSWSIPNLQPGSTATAMIIIISTEKICYDNHGYIVYTSKVVSYNGKPSVLDISDTAISNVNCFGCCNNCNK